MNISKRIGNLSKQLKNIEDSEGFVCDEDGRALINVGAENYDDIFSPYCFKGGDTLSLELVEYLWDKQGAVPLDYDLTINFNVKNADEAKRKEIQQAVKENYENDVHAIDKQLHRLNVLAISFLVLGVLFMSTYLILSRHFSEIITYIIDLFAWVFIWEGVRALFLDKRNLKLDKLKSLRIAASKITVKEFEPY